MRVTVSVFSRFHAFQLAQQLHRFGFLARLITTYPASKPVTAGVPSHAVKSLVAYEVLFRSNRRISAWIPRARALNQHIYDMFDHAAARQIPAETDLYVGWSSNCEQGLATAAQYGAITVVERGSSHIAYQAALLQDEYNRIGIKGTLPLRRTIEKEKREYELADYISVPSDFAKSTFISFGVPENKIIVTPYGVNLTDFQPSERHDRAFRLVYAGQMSLRKGVHYLLQAFSELSLPDAELWLVGPRHPEIEPFFTRFDGSFRYFEAQPERKLAEIYGKCSAFVICSLEEGLALVQLQAMACALPLICTTNSGGADLVCDGVEGFVLPIRDVEQLKDKILLLYRNQALAREMGRAARLRVQHGWSWDDYGSRITGTYGRLLSVKGLGSAVGGPI